MYVLGGEEPIDYVQRLALKHKETLPPLLRKIAEIHVTEEARHISFARTYLRERVPSLPLEKKLSLALSTPMLLGKMTPLMLRPSQNTVSKFQIPKSAWTEAYQDNRTYRKHLANATEKVRVHLSTELGLMSKFSAATIWTKLGIAG